MKSASWKTALWDVSWEELATEKYSVIGNCTFDEQNGITLEIPFGDLSESRSIGATGLYAYSIEGDHYDSLVGFSQDGKRLALLDVHSRGVSMRFPGSSTECFFSATAYISDNEFDPRASIKYARLDLHGVSDWLGYRIESSIEDDHVKLSSSGAEKTQLLYECERFCVILRYGQSRPVVSQNAIESHRYAFFDLELKESISLDELWHDVVWRLQCLFALFYGFYPSIESLTVTLEGCPSQVAVYRASSNGCDRKVAESMSPISFRTLQSAGLIKAAAYLFELQGEERHAVEILTSLLGGWDAPFELQLMAANSMIEAMARAKNGFLYSKKEFAELTKPIIDVAPDMIKQRVEGIIGLLKNPSYSMLLDRINDECRPWFSRLVGNWKLFKKEQIEFRTRGAHGKAVGGASQPMIDHYYAQICLGYHALMLRMGLSDEVLNHFEESNFLNVARWHIQEHYSC